MEVRFNEESTKNIVEGYYKKYEDFECSLEIRKSIKEHKHPTRPIPPVKYVDISFMLNGILNIDGKNIPVSVPTSFDEIKAVFKTTLEADGYAVRDVEINYDRDGNLDNDDENGFKYVVVDMSTKRKIK